MDPWIAELLERYPDLEPCREAIIKAANELEQLYRQGNKLLLAGNGGSASDADHIAGELLKSFYHPRPIEGELRERLGNDLANKLQRGLPALALPNQTGLVSAYNNDCEPDYVYAQLTLALGQPGDMLLVLTTSGNSRNLIEACRTARATGLTTLGLTGRDGGKICNLLDIEIRVPAEKTHHIQERHLPLYHALCLSVEERIFA